MQDKILKEVEYTKVNGGLNPASESIIRETALNISVDGRHLATAMILAPNGISFFFKPFGYPLPSIFSW